MGEGLQTEPARFASVGRLRLGQETFGDQTILPMGEGLQTEPARFASVGRLRLGQETSPRRSEDAK